jgi:hypothetical protein
MQPLRNTEVGRAASGRRRPPRLLQQRAVTHVRRPLVQFDLRAVAVHELR